MPTLDDTPILEQLAGASVTAEDEICIFDVSTKKVKAITIAELIVALDALAVEE
jgi:hypothetical protein